MMNCGGIKYKMSKETAKMLLSSRKGEEKKINSQKFLCDYVDNNCGLMYKCVEVLFLN